MIIETEYNDVNENNHPLQKAHTEILLQSQNASDDLQKELVNSIPFLAKEIFESHVLSNNYDILVYSLLVDYTQDLYQNKTNGFKVPYESYSHFKNESKEDFISRCKQHEFKNMTGDFYNFFKEQYKYIGQISEEDLLKNLNKIRKQVKKPIIFINGAEVEAPKQNKTEYQKAKFRHQKMNQALKKFCEANENTYILDVRKFVSESDIHHSVRHYKRSVYEHMATELISIIEKINQQSFERNEFKFLIKRTQKVITYSIKNFAKLILSRASLLLK